MTINVLLYKNPEHDTKRLKQSPFEKKGSNKKNTYIIAFRKEALKDLERKERKP